MSPALRILSRIGIGIAAVLLLLIVTLAVFPWNRLKHPIERIASAHLGRPVHIEGALHAHIWSFNPTFTLEGLTVGDPAWEERPLMLRVEHLQVQLQLLSLLRTNLVLPRVEVRHPDLYLHREKSGRVNWSFENTAPTDAPAKKPAKLPVIRDLLIEQGKLAIADDIRRLKVEGTVEAHQTGSEEDPKALRIAGNGELNEESFSMLVTGGPLMNLEPGDPYPFDLQIRAGEVRLRAEGALRRPFDLADVKLALNVSGRDLADLFYLTQLTLPNSPPYTLRLNLDRRGTAMRLSEIVGKLGGSDIGGNVDLDLSRKRPMASGQLSSQHLRVKDLVASVGANTKPSKLQPKGTAAQPVAEPAVVSGPNARLFPDARLQLDRVRAMDAEVQYQAASVELGTLPMKQVFMHIHLKEGVLALDPLRFTMEQGKVEGSTRIDARQQVPVVDLDMRVRDIQLDQFKGKAPNSKPPLSGVMQARARLEGRGDSVRRVFGDANGTFTVVLPQGQVNAALAELTGINIAKGLGLLLKNADEREPLRCGVAQFQVRQGVMHAETLELDAKDVRITGKGDINLGSEQLALEVRGAPKKLRLTRLRTPIEIRGHLLDPHIGIDVGATAKQGAVAAALGALTPIAALLAFVDPGLAKDENCAELLGGAAARAAAPPQAASAPGPSPP